MKKIKVLIDKLIGEEGVVVFEQRMFNTISLLCALFALMATILNFSLNMNILSIFLAGIGTILLSIYYMISRTKNIYKPLIAPLILTSTILIGIVWFYKGGSYGGVLLLFMGLMAFFISITAGINQILSIVWTIFIPILLLIIEYYNKELVLPYPNSTIRHIDIAVTFFLAMFIVALGSVLVVTNFRRERLNAENRAKELEKKNEKIENELKLAQKIQENLIKLNYTYTNIGIYYKAMEMVGGDFFDFIEISKNKFGIFISDVAGHGVPAAFITAILKSYTMQNFKIRENPAIFMENLNEKLLKLTYSYNYFVTAFYGIYDRKNRLFTFVNAGHNHPFLISDKTIDMLDIKESSVPLAIFPQKELEQFNKNFKNNEIILERGHKLFFYTDGLVETIKASKSANHNNEFGLILREILEANKSLRCKQMVKKVAEELAKFRAADYYDDDVCIICIEL